MTLRSTLAPGEVLTSKDVHDLCRVRRKPVTPNDPIQVFDLFAQDGAWERKYMAMAVHEGECPWGKYGCGCGVLVELKFLGYFYATGHTEMASKHCRNKERWGHEFEGKFRLNRVESAFKYMFGERMDHLLVYTKPPQL